MKVRWGEVRCSEVRLVRRLAKIVRLRPPSTIYWPTGSLEVQALLVFRWEMKGRWGQVRWILWVWDWLKNWAYLLIFMGFIEFLPLVVVFAHFAHFGGWQSHFKHFDYFVGAPWWPPKVINPLRYPHHSCRILAPPKNMYMLKNEAPQYLILSNL